MNQQEARQAAKALMAYWASRGVAVQAVALNEFYAQSRVEGSHFQFTIRTTPPMVNGLPKGVSKAVAQRLWRDKNPRHSAIKDT